MIMATSTMATDETYAVYLHGRFLCEIPASQVDVFKRMFTCWVDDKTRTILLT